MMYISSKFMIPYSYITQLFTYTTLFRSQFLALIKGDADPLLCVAQIHLVCKSFRSNRFGLPGIEAGYRNRIKKCITGQDEPAALKPLCCQSGNSVDLFCYSPEPFGAVIDSIKACNHRQQDLSCTDVGGCFFPPDMLLTGLQGHSVGRVAFLVDRCSDDSARYLSFKLFPRCKIGSVRASVTHRNAKSLCGSHYHICAHLPGRCEKGQTLQIGSRHYIDVMFMCSCNQVCQISYVPGRVRVL